MKKVLFVCMGNICRSPAAEGILKKFIDERKLNKLISVDSAGTIGYHKGELPDERMQNIAASRGYELDSRARKFDPRNDFTEFDYIVTMDDENYADIIRYDRKKLYKDKIYKMVNFINDKKVTEVPDPYDGGNDEFNYVIDILEDGVKNLLDKIEDELE